MSRVILPYQGSWGASASKVQANIMKGLVCPDETLQMPVPLRIQQPGSQSSSILAEC